MKTLYISDLDGTLLNNASQISEYTKNTLNSLIAKGMLFSVATARGACTIMQLFNGISLNLPIVTLTGAIIYDPVTNSFPVKNSISKTAIDQICDCLATLHLNAFMQVAEKDEINVFYHSLKDDFEKFYVKRRNDKGFFNFKQIENLKNATSFGEVVLISVMNTKPVIDDLLPFLQNIPEISTITYREEGGSDNYYLEIFAKDVSKANAIKELKSLCNIDEIIVFGDDINDLPMFEISNFSVATQNALPEVKAAANITIGTNETDSVAKWLLANGKF